MQAVLATELLDAYRESPSKKCRMFPVIQLLVNVG